MKQKKRRRKQKRAKSKILLVGAILQLTMCITFLVFSSPYIAESFAIQETGPFQGLEPMAQEKVKLEITASFASINHTVPTGSHHNHASGNCQLPVHCNYPYGDLEPEDRYFPTTHGSYPSLLFATIDKHTGLEPYGDCPKASNRVGTQTLIF